MKRLYISLALLALLAALSTAHILYLHSFTGELTELLTQAQEQVDQENWEQAEELTSHAQDRWVENEAYLHTTLHHADIDAILISFGETLAYLQGQEHQPAEYAAANAKLITQLKLLIEGELPTWKNLL